MICIQFYDLCTISTICVRFFLWFVWQHPRPFLSPLRTVWMRAHYSQRLFSFHFFRCRSRANEKKASTVTRIIRTYAWRIFCVNKSKGEDALEQSKNREIGRFALRSRFLLASVSLPLCVETKSSLSSTKSSLAFRVFAQAKYSSFPSAKKNDERLARH